MGPRQLRELFTVANFVRKRGGLAGQVSTFMLLMIAGALVLTLATANMGQLAVRATGASNAADTAALLLGSQLATTAHGYWDSLKDAPDDGRGSVKRCRAGLLALILRVLIQLVVIAFAGPLGLYLALINEGLSRVSPAAARVGNIIMLAAAMPTVPLAGIAIGTGAASDTGNPALDAYDKYVLEGDRDSINAGKKMTMMVISFLFKLVIAIAAAIIAPQVGWVLLVLLALSVIALSAAVTALNGGSQADYVLDVASGLLIIVGAYAKIIEGLRAAADTLQGIQATNAVVKNLLAGTAYVLDMFAKGLQTIGDTVKGVSDAVSNLFTDAQRFLGLGQITGHVGGQVGETAAGALPSSLVGFEGGGTQVTAMSDATGVITNEAGSVTQAFTLATGETALVPAGHTLNVTSGTMAAAPLAAALNMPKAIAYGAATTAATLYNIYVADQIAADALAAAAKSTQGLRVRERIQESAFHLALSQTVEDPNWTRGPTHPEATCFWGRAEIIYGDPDDSDLDGNTAESVPCFQYFWFKRIQELKQETLDGRDLVNLVQKFLSAQNSMDNTTRGYYQPRCHNGSCHGTLLSRESIEGTSGGACGSGGRCNGDQDGLLVQIAKAIEATGTDVRYWTPGPTLPQLRTWEAEESCDDVEALTCDGSPSAPPPGLDDLDAVIAELMVLTDVLRELKSQDRNLVASSVDNWLLWFYEPPQEQPNDAYFYSLINSLDEELNYQQVGIAARLADWRRELQVLRAQLPACEPLPTGGPGYANPPCRTSRGFSIDQRADDEYVEAVGQLNSLIAQLRKVAENMKTFAERVSVVPRVGIEWGGINPVIYRWRDSRGDQAVVVQVSHFKIPQIKMKKSLMKSCLKLKYYDDPSGESTWVKICSGLGCVPEGVLTEGEPPRSVTDGWDWTPSTAVVQKRSRVGWGMTDPGAHEESKAGWYVRVRGR